MLSRGGQLLAVTLFRASAALAADPETPPPAVEPAALQAADGPPSHAGAPADDSAQELFSLESSLEVQVVSTTKTELRTAQTPGVVTVVAREEIVARGYDSLAQVLRSVPGFYDVYDLVTHNVGIRGINGGARASGNLLKLMIDGHPVDYRVSTGNFFGPELIPLEVVERVEIIRGPASALYGANAFLGVVNVITRGGEGYGVRARLEGLLMGARPGLGGGLSVGGAAGDVEVLAAASLRWTDRSGLALPASSPILGRPHTPVAERGPSEQDLERPGSFFAKARFSGLLAGRITLMASMQSLDAAGEFQDFGPLSHGTRIAQLNQNYRLLYEVAPTDALSLQLSVSYLRGGPRGQERLDVGRSDHVFLRSVAVDGVGVTGEAHAQVTQSINVVGGADFVIEDHLLQSFDQLLTENVLQPDGAVLRSAGTVIPHAQRGARAALWNAGAFLQGFGTWSESFSAVAGARVDIQNIYGTNLSGRAGLVYAPPDRALSLKLLYGSSFKAPSAEQLYTQPIRPMDIQGNPELRPQTAHTTELAGAYALGDFGELALNLFVTRVSGRVEFILKGGYQQAQNISEEWAFGGELDARLRLGRSFQLRLAAGVARSVVARAPTALLPDVTNPLFPPYQVHLFADYAFAFAGLRAGLELSYIGPRSATQSNALERGQAYELPPYVFTAATLSLPARRLLKDRETTVSVRLTNVLDQRWIEPGSGGIDLPAGGFTGQLSLVQTL